MNYKILFLLFVGAFLISCKKEPSISFSTHFFSQKELEICKDHSCSLINISYPVAMGKPEVSKRINTTIEQFIMQTLFLGDDEHLPSKNIIEAAENFIFSYRDHQTDIPLEIDTGGYEALIDLTTTYYKESIVSIQAESYLYTGGVNGSGFTNYLNFDIQTGALIDIKDLVTNFDLFQSFVEKRFRLEHKIPKQEPINFTGLRFKDNTFYIPNNVGVSSENLTIIYNIREIASYEEGAFVLKIPIKDVLPFLKV